MKTVSNPIPVITIDGASGTGKGTLGHNLAVYLRWHFLDSGVLYRALALHALNLGVQPDDLDALAKLAQSLPLSFHYSDQAQWGLYLDEVCIDQSIRTETIGNLASIISAHPLIRSALLARQRDFRKLPGLVTDGRDMGTVVFPDAALKFFLTASLSIRAKRRYDQLRKAGIDANLHSLESELELRDVRDRNRAISPLVPAPDAICIETDNKTAEQVFSEVCFHLQAKGLLPLSN